jgi:signal recognition particle subunit SRP54
MTKYERNHPETLKAGHRKRIAAGSGTQVQDVNQLLKQFEQTKVFMKQMKGNKRFKF